MSKHKAKSQRRKKPAKQSREQQRQAEWSACVVHLFSVVEALRVKTMPDDVFSELQRLRERQRAMVKTC